MRNIGYQENAAKLSDYEVLTQTNIWSSPEGLKVEFNLESPILPTNIG
jgi:hypothetical protein